MTRKMLILKARFTFAAALLSAALVFTVMATLDPLNLSERTNRAEGATIAQTLSGCQKGNELRRAVLSIATEQASRSGATEGQKLDLDLDAFTITPCRQVVITITGRDPGHVSNFKDD